VTAEGVEDARVDSHHCLAEQIRAILGPKTASLDDERQIAMESSVAGSAPAAALRRVLADMFAQEDP